VCLDSSLHLRHGFASMSWSFLTSDPKKNGVLVTTCPIPDFPGANPWIQVEIRSATLVSDSAQGIHYAQAQDTYAWHDSADDAHNCGDQ